MASMNIISVDKGRRKILIIFLLMIVGSTFFMIFKHSPFSILMKRKYYALKGKLRGNTRVLTRNERTGVGLNKAGYQVSVEKALNSRCSSDHDNNPYAFHWGVFDHDKKISDSALGQIAELFRTVRFTDNYVEVRRKKNRFLYIVGHSDDNETREQMMIESGMQQQTACLLGSAFGVGVKFNSLGVNGEMISDSECLTNQIDIDVMRPPYGNLYWTTALVDYKRDTLSGLPSPRTNGVVPLVTALSKVSKVHEGKTEFDETILSQLLWAARGKTPHLYFSRKWGMTVPTWHGLQDLTSIYCIRENRVERYVNWQKDKPTHDLVKLKELSGDYQKDLFSKLKCENCVVVVSTNENSGRALWETGFQLQNLILQAYSLDVTYEAMLLLNQEKELFKNTGISSPAAIMLC